MKEFTDYNGSRVRMVFANETPFTDVPKHVLVLTRNKQSWVITDHKVRGYEFPGGKVEKGETTEDAAKREVWEETGGMVGFLHYIGQYEVGADDNRFYKSIFATQIERLHEKDDYLETNGVVMMEMFPRQLKLDQRFSFIMKDDVVPLSIDYAKKLGLFT